MAQKTLQQTIDMIAAEIDAAATYFFGTEAEWNAFDKTRIPVGGTVVKQWLFPASLPSWDYSLGEQPVLNPDGSQKKWIDGKPLFRRVWPMPDFSFSSNNNTITIPGLDSSVIESVISAGVTGRPNSGANMAFCNASVQLLWSGGNTVQVFTELSAWSAWQNACLMLEYTKR